MASIQVYLSFNGNCEEAFNFYKSVFGGEFTQLNRFGDMPPQEGMEITAEDQQKIMHVSLPISGGAELLGSDVSKQFAHGFVEGNNVALSVNANSREETEKIFHGLSESGKVTMPLADTFWGAYFGMWTDKFGIHWMVNYDDPAQSRHS